MKAFPEDLIRTSGFQILAHEGYAAFMGWKMAVKGLREGESEVMKMEKRLIDKKQKQQDKEHA
eukprot:3723951-Karenia_brevis.AAC.1